MPEEIDQDPEKEEDFVEVDGEKFKEDPENAGEALKDEEGNAIPFEEQSKETEEPVTADDAMNLAKALQKGYTLNRQEMALYRENQGKIQEALDEIRKGKDEFGGGEEEPLTVKKFLDLQKQQQQTKEKEDAKLNQKIDSQLSDLRVQGIIKTEEDEKALLDFAVQRKITNLSDAASRWKEIEDAKKEGVKEGLKGKVKVEAGNKVGTSQKTGAKEQGVDYNEVHDTDMEDLAEE